MKKGKTTSEYLKIIFRWRKFVIQNVIFITLFSVVLSLIITHKYTATTTILPPSSETESMLGLLSGGVLSSLSNISQVAGRLPGLTSPSDLYAAILKSGTIKSALINRFNLKKEFKVKTMYAASKALDKITKISVTPEGIIEVSVTYKNKYLATDIANAYIEELDKFNTETSMTMGKKYRIFIEKRLKQVSDSLTYAENSLREFQEKHRTVVLDEEVKNAIEAVVKLKSDIILKEAQREAIGSVSSFDNPYLNNLNQEIQAMKSQLQKIEFGGPEKTNKEYGAGFSVPFAKLPELSLAYARLFRDVKVQEAVYELLTQQYEQAKIMEAKDTPTIQILDRASPPEKRSFPKRTAIVILGFLFSLLGSIPMIFFYEYLIDMQRNPENHKFAIEILSSLINDFSKLKKILKKPSH